MAKVEEKIRFLKEYRAHPEKYFPLIDHAWKCFAEKDTGENPWDDPEYNIGWNAGVIGGNRPFFLECRATCGITVLTYFVSVKGIEEYGEAELLKMLEGTIVNVPPQGGRKHPDQEFIHVNTANILFICGGAFEGIERTIAQRLHTQVIGFAAQQETEHLDKSNMLQYIAPQDLKSYGLIPEIIGRLPVLTHLNPLDHDALRAILTQPKNALTKQYQKLLAMDNVTLVFED